MHRESLGDLQNGNLKFLPQYWFSIVYKKHPKAEEKTTEK